MLVLVVAGVVAAAAAGGGGVTAPAAATSTANSPVFLVTRTHTTTNVFSCAVKARTRWYEISGIHVG